MRDFLVGTIGKLLQWTFGFVGLFLVIGSFIGRDWKLLIFGTILMAMAGGMRYALGYIVRMR